LRELTHPLQKPSDVNTCCQLTKTLIPADSEVLRQQLSEWL
jgi:hypothetical protein